MNNFINKITAILLFVTTLALVACGGGSPSSTTPDTGGGGGTLPVTLSSIVVSPGTVFVPVGSSVSFSATGVYSNNTQKDLSNVVTWKSSDTTHAPIDSNGNVLAKQVVAANISITAAYDGKTSSAATLNITDAALQSITIKPGNTVIPLGTNPNTFIASTASFVAIGNYSNGTQQVLCTPLSCNANLVWGIDSPDGSAILDSIGNATGMVASTTGLKNTVTATYYDPTTQKIVATGTANMTVTGATLTSISVPNTGSGMRLTYTPIVATGTYSDGTQADVSGVVAWKTNNTNALVNGNDGSFSPVDQYGMISGFNGMAGWMYGQANGTSVISAYDPTNGGWDGTVNPAVFTPGLVSNNMIFSVSPVMIVYISTSPDYVQMPIADTNQMAAIGFQPDGTTAPVTSSNATWTTSNQNVATINSSGLVTAVGNGVATITVSTPKINPTVFSTSYINVAPNPTQLILAGTDSILYPTVASQQDPNAVTLSTPAGVATDGTNLYVADSTNNQIYEVNITTGVATVLAGSGSPGSTNGNGTNASFNNPSGITINGTILYVADANNAIIRKVDTTNGTVSTLAGSGSVGNDNNQNGMLATFFSPSGIENDGTNIYVSDIGNNNIRQINIATGAVITLAGNTSAVTFNGGVPQQDTGGLANGIGNNALFTTPTSLTKAGLSLYITDTNNALLRQLFLPTGEVTTFSGTGVSAYADGGPSTASFVNPGSLTADGVNLYVTDSGYDPLSSSVINKVRIVSIKSGVVTTQKASLSGAAQISGITNDGKSLYVSDIFGSQLFIIK